jgi:hypothetical protein
MNKMRSENNKKMKCWHRRRGISRPKSSSRSVNENRIELSTKKLKAL